jgi:hypothetical protein
MVDRQKLHHKSIDFEKFKVEHDVDIIYLYDELIKLYNHDFENSRLNHVKISIVWDVFYWITIF